MKWNDRTQATATARSPSSCGRYAAGCVQRARTSLFVAESAFMGSILDARSAGMNPAPRATTARATVETPSSPGDHIPSISNSSDWASRPTPTAADHARSTPPMRAMIAHLPHHHAAHRAAVGAKGHAQAELARALRHGEGQHAVETDPRPAPSPARRNANDKRADQPVHPNTFSLHLHGPWSSGR